MTARRRRNAWLVFLVLAAATLALAIVCVVGIPIMGSRVGWDWTAVVNPSGRLRRQAPLWLAVPIVAIAGVVSSVLTVAFWRIVLLPDRYLKPVDE